MGSHILLFIAFLSSLLLHELLFIVDGSGSDLESFNRMSD